MAFGRKKIVTPEEYNRMDLDARRASCPDISNSGLWLEKIAIACGFEAEDFKQNPDFYRGANLWKDGTIRNETSRLDASFSAYNPRDPNDLNYGSILIKFGKIPTQIHNGPSEEAPHVIAFLKISKNSAKGTAYVEECSADVQEYITNECAKHGSSFFTTLCDYASCFFKNSQELDPKVEAACNMMKCYVDQVKDQEAAFEPNHFKQSP